MRYENEDEDDGMRHGGLVPSPEERRFDAWLKEKDEVIAALEDERQRWLDWAEAKGPGLEAYREQGRKIAELEALLATIHDMAHDASTGPTAPDVYWAIRELAGNS